MAFDHTRLAPITDFSLRPIPPHFTFGISPTDSKVRAALIDLTNFDLKFNMYRVILFEPREHVFFFFHPNQPVPHFLQ